MGARVPLVEVLVAMQAPVLVGEDWTGPWALLADPDPAVRRAAIPLAAGIVPLLEQWRVGAFAPDRGHPDHWIVKIHRAGVPVGDVEVLT